MDVEDIVFSGFVLALVFGLGVVLGAKAGIYAAETGVAKGELACEYHYGERVCWNPKEDE